jgi:hypothetical protein
VGLCQGTALFEPDYTACTFGFPMDPKLIHSECD